MSLVTAIVVLPLHTTPVNAAAASTEWSTLLNGSSIDDGADVTTDASGNIYVTGTTTSAGFLGQTSKGAEDAFVVKLNADGSVAWTKLLGGTGSDQGQGISVDAAGDVYVTGLTFSTSFEGVANIRKL